AAKSRRDGQKLHTRAKWAGRGSKTNQKPTLPRVHMVNAAGMWDESYLSYPGRSHGRADVFFFGWTANNCREKSAEAIVPRLRAAPGFGKGGRLTKGEGPNLKE